METSGRRRWSPQTSWVVCAALVVTVAARLPLLDLPAWADEAGLLAVGGGWRLGGHGGTGSLYGAYWVDRPPVLVTVFGLADRLGGLHALRLGGAVAAAVAVAGVAWIAHTVAGPRAARWAAVVAAALLSTPFHWSFMVDGELLAAPFVALGIGCAAAALKGVGDGDAVAKGTRGLVLSGASGAAAVAALLTKQNIADVFVFVAVLVTIRLLSRSLPGRAAARHAAAFLVGAGGFAGVVAVWTVVHGTSLGGVWYAMYPFRVDAAAAKGGGTVSWTRLADMGIASVLSGLAVLTVWVVLSGVRKRHRDAPVLALLAVLAYDVFSVAAGTNYWLHYLVQPAVPVAALTGILAARGSTVRIGGVLAVATALAGWVVLVMSPPQTAEEMVGRAIAGVSTPHDSIVTFEGRSNVNLAAGLGSPYPYLWSLPARVLDPRSVALDRLLSGPRAPTWLVAPRGQRVGGPGALGATIRDRYRRATGICDRVVYVRRDVTRAVPVARPRADATAASRCESVIELPHVLRELAGDASYG